MDEFSSFRIELFVRKQQEALRERTGAADTRMEELEEELEEEVEEEVEEDAEGDPEEDLEEDLDSVEEDGTLEELLECIRSGGREAR